MFFMILLCQSLFWFIETRYQTVFDEIIAMIFKGVGQDRAGWHN
jgi:hypothetical protein